MKMTHPFVLPARRICLSKKIIVAEPEPFEFGPKERRPLAQLPAVRLLLKCDLRHVNALIDEGRLRWVFNIATRDAHKHEIRVLWQSVVEFLRLWPKSNTSYRSDTTEFDRVIDLILPPAKMPQTSATREPFLTGAEVSKCFSCNSQHVINLLREQSLRGLAARGLSIREGPKASPLITRASLIQFLKERRIS
jgi:hypothetical protein